MSHMMCERDGTARSCSDLSLSFFDVDSSFKLVRRIETRTAQIVMTWSEVGQAHSCYSSELQKAVKDMMWKDHSRLDNQPSNSRFLKGECK
eukprot:2070890-Amphidinium_carterae.1